MQQNPFIVLLIFLVLGGQGYDIMGGQTSKVEIQQLTMQVTSLVSEVQELGDRITRLNERIGDNEGEIREMRERLLLLERQTYHTPASSPTEP